MLEVILKYSVVICLGIMLLAYRESESKKIVNESSLPKTSNCPKDDPLGIFDGNENCISVVPEGADPKDPLGLFEEQ